MTTCEYCGCGGNGRFTLAKDPQDKVACLACNVKRHESSMPKTLDNPTGIIYTAFMDGMRARNASLMGRKVG